MHSLIAIAREYKCCTNTEICWISGRRLRSKHGSGWRHQHQWLHCRGRIIKKVSKVWSALTCSWTTSSAAGGTRRGDREREWRPSSVREFCHHSTDTNTCPGVFPSELLMSTSAPCSSSTFTTCTWQREHRTMSPCSTCLLKALLVRVVQRSEPAQRLALVRCSNEWSEHGRIRGWDWRSRHVRRRWRRFWAIGRRSGRSRSRPARAMMLAMEGQWLVKRTAWWIGVEPEMMSSSFGSLFPCDCATVVWPTLLPLPPTGQISVAAPTHLQKQLHLLQVVLFDRFGHLPDAALPGTRWVSATHKDRQWVNQSVREGTQGCR